MKPERSLEYQRLNILHMIEFVKIRIHNETGKLVEIPFPETPEDLAKLEEMYSKAIAKYMK